MSNFVAIRIIAIAIVASLGLVAEVNAQAATDLDCNNCVNPSDIATKAVTSSKLGSSAVVTDKIQAGAVTTNKIGNGAVSRSKIRAGAVTEGKLSQDLLNRIEGLENTVAALEAQISLLAPPFAVLNFYATTLNLETGQTCLTADPCNNSNDGTADTPNDFVMAFDSNAMNPAVLLQRQVCEAGEALALAEIAFLDSMNFDSVSANDIAVAIFTSDIIAQSLDPDDTIILKTCEGNFFKIGNTTCNAGDPVTYPGCQDPGTDLGTVRLQYQRLK